PNGTAEPITLFLREPLSGTYNTIEYSEVRIYGTPGGSLGTDGAGKFEATPYISQETNVVVGQPGADPLFLQCPAKYTKGGTGAGEVLSSPGAARLTSAPSGTRSPVVTSVVRPPVLSP